MNARTDPGAAAVQPVEPVDPPAPAPTPAASGLRGWLQRSVLTRFASVGIINSLVDLGLYVGLFAVGVPPFIANLCSTTAGLTVAFFGNSRYVFRSSSSGPREVIAFVLVAGAGIWGIQPLVILGITHLLTAMGVTHVVLVGLVSKLIAIAVAATWNYLLYSRVVFRPRHAQPEGNPPA